jgi:digeranylgeranylglycerophospholipid reductase
MMKPVTEAVVVGGGPVGSYAALNLSRLGVATIVFEEHPEIGLPSHCAGHLSIRSLRGLGLYPLPDGIVENTFSAANFHSPAGTMLSVRLKRPVTCALNRELFDKLLAGKARAAGSEYRLGSRVGSLMIDEGFVRGVNVDREGSVEAVAAKVVVDAEGVSSHLLRETGLRRLNGARLVYAVEVEVEQVANVETDAVEVFVGNAYAPGFYAWVIPRRDGTAKVGLAAKSGNPKELLQRLMFKHPVASRMLGKSRVLKMAFHPVTLGGQIPTTYANGFLAVGDVASQVKPTTGGGVVFGLTCAQIAAETTTEAIQRDDVGAQFLQRYQKRCREKLGFDFSVMLRARRFLDSLSDEKIDQALRTCKRLGLGEALADVEEIDFQGKLLLQMLTKPSAATAIFYLLLLYLSANP